MSFCVSMIPSRSRLVPVSMLLLAATVPTIALAAEPRGSADSTGTQIRIDASLPYRDPGPAPYRMGSATTPSGISLGMNSRYLTLAGKPWLPVMGEFHFSRYPRAQWEDEILKMKAAGVNIVSTYVIWIHHEEVQGQFDWNGQRDLRAFVQLCARHGMYVVARIGPWDHGEVRNGGLPDWTLKQGPTRVNDPVYLGSVRIWYGQIAEQLKGLLWKDGGPVLGIQLENEYSKRGPGAGVAHILELKKIAVVSGLDVPLYLVTGWDNAIVPPGEVIPVYGGYPDAPWDSSILKLPPAEVYAFRFQSRVAANVNTSSARSTVGAQTADAGRLPYFTAEIGGGIEDTYHRRPVIASDDIAAMFPVMLGSGVNLYGTYMFHGGENPQGRLSTLQESQDTGYPNDLPIKSYDFQAPLDEFGKERISFRKLKVFQYFLNDFGSELAPMAVHAPETTLHSPVDLSVPRASVRSKDDTGFIFVNNYVRGYAMPARPAAQFLIRLPHGALAVPSHPVDLPSGAYFIWPFNLRVGDVTLRYSTAQPFTLVDAAGKSTLYFEAQPGIAPEFALDAATVRSVKTTSGEVVHDSGIVYVRGIEPGNGSAIEAVSAQGSSVRMVVMTAHEAENAWKVRIGGSDHLLITKQDLVADPDTNPARICLRSRGVSKFVFSVTPPLTVPLKANLQLQQTTANDIETEFGAQAPTSSATLECRQIRHAGTAPPVRLGPELSWRLHGVAEAPEACELPAAAVWAITIPAGALDGLNELYLRVQYKGDLARLSANHRIQVDNFWNGKPWMIGLKRFLAAQGPSTFELSILPLRKDAPVYFEMAKPPSFAADGQIDTLDDIHLIPEYQLEITTVHD